MKTISQISETRVLHSMRARFNPIKTLTPDSLSDMLDAFSSGYLKSAAMTWDAIERRDDVIQGVANKRKKSIARLPWKILTTDDSEEALNQKHALQYFYNNLVATNACDSNEQGGFGLLIKQMMDSVGKKYAVHEIVFQPTVDKFASVESLNNVTITATFRFVPLWFFERKDGKLKFLEQEGALSGVPLDKGAWMVTVGDGLMEACSIAYLFKHLPLRDWLVYCERNGMPGVKGVTDALPNSEQWEAAKEAVEDFGAEFHALMTRGTDIEAIDISTKGTLPYPGLIDRMDRAIAALWRGSDLTTLSRNNSVGASLQCDETNILEEDDAAMISETLNAQVDKHVLQYIFGETQTKAYIKLMPTIRKSINDEVSLFKQMYEMGMPISISDMRERFGITTPSVGENVLQK